jgi:hypothetical protein
MMPSTIFIAFCRARKSLATRSKSVAHTTRLLSVRRLPRRLTLLAAMG